MADRAASGVLITAEHGGNRVPAAYRALFRGHRALLQSHRGHDPGSLVTARGLARRLGAPLLFSTTTRLLVDLNREETNPQAFSVVTRSLSRDERERLLARFHRPHRAAVDRHVADLLRSRRRVVHIASHSFTPVLDGKRRGCDVGLLYDPRRRRELALCDAWRQACRTADPALRVHRNRPYTGRSDGLTRWLRGRHPPSRYLGIELELNQGLLENPARLRALRRLLEDTLCEALAALR